jgi:hypothetical protein
MASIRAFRSDRTLNVNLVSFFMFAKFYHCSQRPVSRRRLTIIQEYVILYHPQDDKETT